MYIVEFFKNLFKKNNTGTIIWMACNLVIICGCCILFCSTGKPTDAILGIVIGIIIYIISIAIALSSFGERILRAQNGCKLLDDSAILSRIQPLFDEVYDRAKSKNSEISADIQLFISEDSSPNAFALGRNTVCITQGLLSISDDDIRGILGHEFGHLAHKDTDTILVIAVGNLIVSAIFTVWRILFKFFAGIFHIAGVMAAESFWGKVTAWIAGEIVRIFVDFLLLAAMALWTKLGVWICMASSRANEYLADKYSYELGYGSELCSALKNLGAGTKSKGLFAALSSSHPDTIDRINKLNSLTSTTVN